MNLYPCCSATPAQTTLAEAPIRVPFPKRIWWNCYIYVIIIYQNLNTITSKTSTECQSPYKWLQWQVESLIFSQRDGDFHHHCCQWNVIDESWGQSWNLFWVEIKINLRFNFRFPEITHKMIRMATIRRDSSPTERITFSVWRPIQSMRPSSERASIRTNRAAKKSNVDHSTRAKTASMSSLKLKWKHLCNYNTAIRSLSSCLPIRQNEQ